MPHDAHGREIPIAKIAQHHIDRAHRFRAALALTLQLRDQLDDCECRDRAFAAFQRLNNGSEKTWTRWTKRVLQRDAGEKRFDDLALYLDEVVTVRSEHRTQSPIAVTTADRIVLDALAAIANKAKPSLEESALVWSACCEFIEESIDGGQSQKKAQRRVYQLLARRGVTLARTDSALRRLVRRKYDRWITGGRTFQSLEDQRPLKCGSQPRVALSEEDRVKVIHHAVKSCGGRVAQAWRELLARGALTADPQRYYLSNTASKSYVPKSIRDAVAGDVKRLKAYQRGPRAHKLGGAYHTRDWSNVAAGDWYQSDDFTPPFYFYKQSGEVMRGQFLPMIDERTTMILGFVLIQEKSYNSLSIRGLITNVCKEHGLPRSGFYFERGIWKSSRVLSGDREIGGDQVLDTGLRRLGMKLRHALLPRAKVIERVGGQLQDRMESWPGYCGRDEMKDKLERFHRLKLDIESGRAIASDHLFSAYQAAQAFVQICDDYNSTPQQGRKLEGLSPKDGWERLQGSAPRSRFTPETHYFLASDVRRLRVGRNGLTIQVGKQRFNYKGAETGRRRGEEVVAWFNPQSPEFLACTRDLKGNDVFVIERSYELPAVDAPPELLRAENAKMNAHNAYARDLYHTFENVLPISKFRHVVDRPGMQLGREIEAQQQQLTARRRAKEERSARKARKCRGLIPAELVRDSDDAIESLDDLTATHEAFLRELKEENLHDSKSELVESIGSSAKKVFVLDAPTKPPLTAQQRNAMYWRLWKAAEQAQPGLNRFALTSRVLGSVKKITEMTDEQFLKICHVFEKNTKKNPA